MSSADGAQRKQKPKAHVVGLGFVRVGGKPGANSAPNASVTASKRGEADIKKREAVVKRVRAAGPVNNERTASPGQLAGGGCGYFSSNRRVSSAMNVLMSLN